MTGRARAPRVSVRIAKPGGSSGGLLAAVGWQQGVGKKGLFFVDMEMGAPPPSSRPPKSASDAGPVNDEVTEFHAYSSRPQAFGAGAQCRSIAPIKFRPHFAPQRTLLAAVCGRTRRPPHRALACESQASNRTGDGISTAQAHGSRRARRPRWRGQCRQGSGGKAGRCISAGRCASGNWTTHTHMLQRGMVVRMD